MRRTLILSAATVSVVLSTSPVAQSGPCFDSDVGTSLGLTDESVAASLPLQFNFPIRGLAGVTTNAIDVTSNGVVYLEAGIATSSRCCHGSVTTFLSTVANISVWWHDLNVSHGGDVLFNSLPNKAIVTWMGVPEHYDQPSNTVQLQMFPDGSFQIAFEEITQPGSHSVLVGFTPGNGAADPGEHDLSTLPISTAAEPTVYELFDIATDTRDLDNWGASFIPNTAGGWDVLPMACATKARYGHGCPNPLTFYETFEPAGSNDLSGSSILIQPNAAGTAFRVSPAGPGQFLTGYANNLLLRDDQLATSLALGFTIWVPGAGPVSAIEVSSNGYAAPAGVLHGVDPSESVDEFLRLATRWAPCWDDFDPNRGGGVYFDILAGGAAVVTWDQVPQFLDTDSNTFQLQIRRDGSFLYVWQNVADDALVGFSIGNGAPDHGAIDISNDLPIAGGDSGTPLQHSSIAPPSLGTNVTWRVSNIPSGATLTAINFGFNRLAIDLSAVGAPSCFVFASAEIAAPLAPPTNGTSSLTLPVPNVSTLVGGTLYTQGVVAGVSVNTLGTIASNAIANTFGS